MAFEAYKIGITVAMTNQVSSVLMLVSRQFGQTEAAAARLRRELQTISLMGAGGLVLGGVGYAGLRLAEGIVKPATEYAHQLNIMNMAGLKQQEVAEAIGKAWQNTSDVVATTATGNLRMLLDMRNVLGSMGEATMALPIISKIQAVMASSSEAGVRKTASDNFAFSMAKALDIIGAASDPQRFEREAREMAQVITAFQGRVTPAQFQSVFAYARQAKFGLNEDFRYSILPTLMLEYAQGSHSQGGGSRGVGPALAAFARLTLQGYINKKAMPELERLGLVDPRTALRTTTSGTTIGPMARHDLAAANPFLWVQDVLMPAIERRFGGHATRDQIMQEIITVTRGNQLASQLMLEFALKSQNFLRDQRIIHGTMPYDRAYQAALHNDPDFALDALRRQWGNFKTALGTAVIPVLVPALIELSGGLNTLSRWAKDNPAIIKPLVYSFIGLSASLAFSGVVLTLTAAFRSLSLVLGIGGLAAPGLMKLGGNLGLVAAGMAKMLGPVALLVGILAYFHPDKATLDKRIAEGQANPLGIGKDSPAEHLWNWLTGNKKGATPDSGAPAAPNPVGGARGEAQTDHKGMYDAVYSAIRDGLASVGINIDLDGHAIGRGIMGDGPPTDSGSSFNSRLHPAYPTGGGT